MLRVCELWSVLCCACAQQLECVGGATAKALIIVDRADLILHDLRTKFIKLLLGTVWLTVDALSLPIFLIRKYRIGVNFFQCPAKMAR